MRRAWPLVCHCLLLETHSGLVLVDTGLGTRQLKKKLAGRGFWFSHFARPRSAETQTALQQIERLGFKSSDVYHIVLTHLDEDHAGGIADFPHAKIHVFGPEYVAAMAPAAAVERIRYHAFLWEHDPKWVLHKESAGENWNGFECVRQLKGLPPEILLIPLSGHTIGHCAIAVQTQNGWLLHAGDAYFDRGQIDSTRRRSPRILNWIQQISQVDQETREHNLERLSELITSSNAKTTVFCSHDRWEFEQFA